MSNADPFASYVSEATLSAIVKNMERRWGLTLVSFFPPEVQEYVVQLQHKVSKLFGGHGKDSIRRGRLYIEFYQPQQFHCTHLTLTRSDPSGPVKAETFLKEKNCLFELFRIIHSITSQTQPIKVVFDRLTMAHDGLGIILLGECADEDSIGCRQTLLENLNQNLPKFFSLSRRSWDIDPSKYHKLHSSLGYLKRSPPQGYITFADDIKRIGFDPLSFAFKDVTLVHHSYRTLAFPQEGSITFPLGKTVDMTEDEFISTIGIEMIDCSFG